MRNVWVLDIARTQGHDMREPAMRQTSRVQINQSCNRAAALNRQENDRTGTYREQARIRRSPHKEGEG